MDQQEELIRKQCWPSTTASRARAVDCCLGAGGRNSFSRCGSSRKQKRLLVQWGQAVQETGSLDQPDSTSCCSAFPACGSVASSYMCNLYTKPALSNQTDSKSWYFSCRVIRLKTKASRRYQLASSPQAGEETQQITRFRSLIFLRNLIITDMVFNSVDQGYMSLIDYHCFFSSVSVCDY